MADVRTILAAVLGFVLGLLFVARPGIVIRVHAVGRRPHDRRGEYGEDAAPARWRRLVQAAGVALLLAGGYFAAVALG